MKSFIVTALFISLFATSVSAETFVIKKGESYTKTRHGSFTRALPDSSPERARLDMNAMNNVPKDSISPEERDLGITPEGDIHSIENKLSAASRSLRTKAPTNNRSLTESASLGFPQGDPRASAATRSLTSNHAVRDNRLSSASQSLE